MTRSSQPPKMLTAKEAGDILGMCSRWMTTQAQQGNIPGAVQYVDRGAWRFDLDKLLRFKRQRERASRRGVGPMQGRYEDLADKLLGPIS